MKKLLAVLGLQVFAFHNNFFGSGKPYARLDEEQLQLIENALEKNGTSEDAETIAVQQTQISKLEENETAVQEAITAALELNGIEAVEGQSVTEAIAALGVKCKEYGDSKQTHSIPPTDGKDRNVETEEPTYGFVEVLNDMSKYPTFENS